MDIVVGTAGHVDHGKTALIKALTGIDADRLPEEKQRGITIDLGFAELDLDGTHIGFVDVPGHERFVKNMLAGASGVDLVMLVIAADEGVMPQTREHFDICRLLGINAGLVALTKADTVDAEMLELARADAAELIENSFLENAPIISVSSKTSEGINQLTDTLKSVAGLVVRRSEGAVARLPIDRSFSVKGFGTVITGTLASGNLEEGGEMELMPEGRRVRVRGLQTHRKTVSRAAAGQRTAVNLAGIDHHEIRRGMVLCEIGTARPTQIIDTQVEILKDAPRPLRSRQRVRFHIGTAEVLARVAVLNTDGEVQPGDKDLVQFRLENPIVTALNETFIIRSYSPQVTIGGGIVLDAFTSKHRRKDLDTVTEFLSNLSEARNDDARAAFQFIKKTGASGFSASELQTRTAWTRERVEAAIGASLHNGLAVNADGVFIEKSAFEKLAGITSDEVARHHIREPLSSGLKRETLREKVFSAIRPEIFKSVLNALERDRKIIVESDIVRSAEHSQTLSEDEKIVHSNLAKIYNDSNLEPPKLDDALRDSTLGTRLARDRARQVFQLLLNTGEVVKVSEEFYFSRNAIAELIRRLRTYKTNNTDALIDVADFKNLAGVSRKYAIPLLEYFDREKITRRAGDKRVIL